MKILFVSLGCDKNLVDTEMMLGMLSEAGHTITDDENDADAIIVNTCCFIGDAQEESINTLIEFGALRTSGKIKALIAAGCLAQRFEKEIRELIPEVDALIGTMAIDEIVKVLDECEKGEKPTYIKPIDGPIVYGKKRLVTTGGHFAYMKIAEGCNKFCTYCVIPKIRGIYRSVPMEVLVKEAETLAEGGVKELILVAQETSMYGIDLYGKKSLPELLRKLSAISGIYNIRILYCYPEEINDELIEEIKTNPKVSHYLDMPIQSGSNEILRRMGRKTTREDILGLITKLRREIPDISLRTSLIAGFPGETRANVNDTVEFIKEARFDRLGVFTYSREDGTPAAGMKGQIPEFIKRRRRNKLMKVQQKIAFEKAAAEIGRELTVMVEGRMPEENAYVCRTYKDAPNVDGYLFLETAKDLMTGDYINVVVTGAKEYDLMGVPTDEFTE